VDPERAPFIKEAFDLYATGNWTTNTLAEHLEPTEVNANRYATLSAGLISLAVS
jgi:hypothetical protein